LWPPAPVKKRLPITSMARLTELRHGLGTVFRAIDKSQDVSRQQEVISSSIFGIAESLREIESGISNWPIYPTGEDAMDSDTVAMGEQNRLADYAAAFEKFARLLKPGDSAGRYRELLDLRARVDVSRKKFAELKANSNVVGTQAVIQEGGNLLMLLARIRSCEKSLCMEIIQEWKNGLASIGNDLSIVCMSQRPTQE
jgi:hypothetical protein